MNRWVWIGLFSVWSFRSSRPEVFCTKGVLKHFANFTGKHLRQSLFFNKAADLRPATLLKNRPWHRCFSVNFTKFLRTPVFIEHIWWLLLYLAMLLRKVLWTCTYEDNGVYKILWKFILCTRMKHSEKSKISLTKKNANRKLHLNNLAKLSHLLYLTCS